MGGRITKLGSPGRGTGGGEVVAAADFLVDQFGRRHNNLRLSVTDKCNLRCTYCMPEFVEFLPKDHLLTFEEITRLVTVAATAGVNKLRLTGGEPLLRKELPELIKMLGKVDGVEDIGLTTNGVYLDELAGPLFAAGLRRVNISLDTLDHEQFRKLTRRDLLDKVLGGIEAAARVGFAPVKINAIAMKHDSDDQIIELARFCRERGFELRFIEFMPLEADRIWDRSTVLSAAEILQKLADAGMPARAVPQADPHAPAADYEYEDGGGRLGIVASVTEPFCSSCNRLRLTAEGKLRNCLFSLDEVDVKGPLRTGANDDQILSLLRQCVSQKWEGHQINSQDFVRPPRTMHTIGG